VYSDFSWKDLMEWWSLGTTSQLFNEISVVIWHQYQNILDYIWETWLEEHVTWLLKIIYF